MAMSPKMFDAKRRTRNAEAKSALRVISLLALVGIALAFGASCSSTPKAQAKKPQGGNILDYFPGTPGLSLTYDFTSEDNPNDNGKRCIIFQKPEHDTEYNFQYTALNTWAGASCIWKTDGGIFGATNNLQNKYWDGAFRYFFI